MESRSTEKLYDCIIIGGGLGGLSLSILLAQSNFSVLVIEKKKYPFHKVCGEYISMESQDFLHRLGLNFDTMELPLIKIFQLTGTNGRQLEEMLEPGGFGISRYSLDKLLAEKAVACGVDLMENTSCHLYEKETGMFRAHTSRGIYRGNVLCASYGRHASGNFFKPEKATTNWVGIKYHITYELPADTIALHTFKNGYCGISNIEDGKCCLCYLVKASLLKKYNNKIEFLEKNELKKNPFLKEILSNAAFVYEKPLTISNVTFEVKEPVYDGVFYLGDSAGSIAPLTGNGMSNALRSAYILHSELERFLKKEISAEVMEKNYAVKWKKEFSSRIRKGRLIQQFFCNPSLTPLFIGLLKKSRFLRRLIIRQTHGESF